MIRCKWCNLKNPKYIEYHDNEWCKPNFDDKYLFEMLILESFQAGLSWECVLNKRDYFKEAFDNFDIDKICNYNEKKIEQLLDDISKDLQKRGMKFVGSTIIYSYLQAIGVIYSHNRECFMYKNR